MQLAGWRYNRSNGIFLRTWSRFVYCTAWSAPQELEEKEDHVVFHMKAQQVLMNFKDDRIDPWIPYGFMVFRCLGCVFFNCLNEKTIYTVENEWLRHLFQLPPSRRLEPLWWRIAIWEPRRSKWKMVPRWNLLKTNKHTEDESMFVFVAENTPKQTNHANIPLKKPIMQHPI